MTMFEIAEVPAVVWAFVIFIGLVTVIAATETFHASDWIDPYAHLYTTAVVIAIGAVYITGVLVGTAGTW